MELHISIYKAPLILNFGALLNYYPITLTHHFFLFHATFSTRLEYFFWISHASITEPSSPINWGRILRGRHHRTRLWNCLDLKWVCCAELSNWYSYFKSVIFCIHTSACSSGVCLSCDFVKSELKHCFSFASHWDQPCWQWAMDSWRPSLVSDWRGGGWAWGVQRLIREYSPKTMNIIGAPIAHQC